MIVEVLNIIKKIKIEQSQRICTEYKKYYNHHRPHQGISGNIPEDLNQNQKNRSKFTFHRNLGGKITSFDPNLLAAA